MPHRRLPYACQIPCPSCIAAPLGQPLPAAQIGELSVPAGGLYWCGGGLWLLAQAIHLYAGVQMAATASAGWSLVDVGRPQLDNATAGMSSHKLLRDRKAQLTAAANAIDGRRDTHLELGSCSMVGRQALL